MKPFLILCFCLNFLYSFSQDKNQFYALDQNMNQTTLDSSRYILWIHEKDSTDWQWDYYYTWGPLIKSTTYADHDGTILNGRFCIYNSLGNLDSTGIYDHGKKNGSFYKYKTFSRDSVGITGQYDYVQDSLLKSIDLLAEPLKNKVPDSTNGTESEYPGGITKWTYYLTHNLVYPDRALTKKIQGKVQISFMIDTEGNVVDPFIQKSVEYSVDQESIRVIKNSGKWIPSMLDGVNKKSYKVIPINYKLQD